MPNGAYGTSKMYNGACGTSTYASYASPTPDFVFKIALVGNSGVGKSCVMSRFADDDPRFVECHLSTIGVDFKIRSIALDDKHVKLQIWDTAGQERFRTITQGYYRGAHGIVVVYDLTDRRSFDQVRDWLSEIERYALAHCCVMLVGNKCDLVSQRVVSTAEGEALAAELGVPFLETSAKQDQNVVESFFAMARAMHKAHVPHRLSVPAKGTVPITKPRTKAQLDDERRGWLSMCSIL